MLDVNAGGDLHCLNTSFSSCIRQSNTPESYPNKNYTQGQRFASASESLITSATFTSCTFREMTGSYGDNTGGSAIFVKSATSVTITQCSLHICNVSGINDDGGCIFYSPPLSGENALVIKTSSFTECKAIGAVFNYGGTLFTRDALLVSIDESFFEKGVAQYGSALFFYYQTTTKISNSSFVDCESLVHSTIRINNYVTISSLDYLLLRNCQANGKPAASDIYFETLLYSDVKSKISFCDSTSGSPNIYFGSTETSDDTLIPQISSTPTVETCEVTFSGNVATVTVTTKEVIGGAMGILLEGCLVPRLVFVVFVTGGQNSTTGSATVSSGANGILPSATYSPSKTRTSSKTRPFMDSQVLWG
ncbi:hypothetical protein BLNAU_5248 [Blattamonas nauphoetae]|uniref:Polymorphic outer membrane protein n=1 Tax=Blattamonas nauphoetae TaxID=2049346 RepID=A0ABQ9Y7U5_9EUKA|nr:hypothetical protein BLNAU_5248 [Blattamonas nauphoetae]